MIQKEGIDMLAEWELQDASRMRGMRSFGMPKERLKLQLEQWLDLHLNEKIPSSLLLLSRTLYMPEHLSASEQLVATIRELPESTVRIDYRVIPCQMRPCFPLTLSNSFEIWLTHRNCLESNIHQLLVIQVTRVPRYGRVKK